MATVAVLGRLGSGKSSLRCLVEGELAESRTLGRSVAFTHLSLWPFDTAEAAVRGILSAIVRELGFHVGTMEFLAIPEQYVRAIETLGTAGGVLSSLIGGRSPDEILDRLEEVTAATGIHLTVWVEDLERFCEEEGSTEGTFDAQRTAPIRALLHLLERRRNLNIVIATNTMARGLDLEKLAQYVEEIPRLDEARIAPVVDRFCAYLAHRFLVLRPKQHRIARRRPGIPHITVDRAQAPDWSDLIRLADTPRILKLALRACETTWSRLAGELNLEDLVLIAVLRVAEPSVFRLVTVHIDRLRDGLGSAMGAAGQPRDDRFSAQLERLHPSGSPRRQAIDGVLTRIFPAYMRGESSERSRPQGLAATSPADYWRRYLTASLLGQPGDQEVIKAANEWEAGVSPALVDLVSTSERQQTVESFSQWMSSTRLLALLADVTRHRMRETPRVWVDESGRYDIPGLTSVWRLFQERARSGALSGEDRTALFDELIALVREALSLNLTVAEGLAFWFGNIEAVGVERLLRDEDCARFGDLIQEELLRLASGPPAAFVKALGDTSRVVLYRLCWGVARIRRGDTRGTPFPEWPKCADLMLRSVPLAPRNVIEQILVFVTRDTRDDFLEDDRTEADLEQIEALFGTQHLQDVLRVFPITPSTPPSSRAYEAVRRAVKL